MPASLTQYVFRVMRRPNMPLQSIVDISCVLPVYISPIRGRHNSELSRAAPVIACKVRVQEAVTYNLGDLIIVSQAQNDFFLPLLGLGIDPNVKDRIQFPQDFGGV